MLNTERMYKITGNALYGDELGHINAGELRRSSRDWQNSPGVLDCSPIVFVIVSDITLLCYGPPLPSPLRGILILHLSYVSPWWWILLCGSKRLQVKDFEGLKEPVTISSERI